MNVNSQTQLCYSILKESEEVKEHSLALFLCDNKALSDKKREYEQSFIDFIFDSGIKLTYKNLDSQIKQYIKSEQDLVYFKFDCQSC